jgi:hypothetical protein
MDARTVAHVEGWDSRPFDGGYDGLRSLADREFTGCVVSGNTYLFMVRGRVVGVFDYTEPPTGEPSVEPADVERFEGAGGTAYEAPEPALALLYAMVATGGETRGRYYSKNTPLEEVDSTLRDGGFTGYLELSENVLSGDYYLVYHGGRRRSVAFVGQSRRIKGDDEAFDLASEEVGIYEVTAVELSTVEIPGSSGGGDDTTAVGAAGSDPPGGDGGADPTTTDDDPGQDHGLGGALDASGGDAADTPAPESPGTDRDGSTGSASTGSASTGSTDATGAGGTPGDDRPEIDLDAAMNPRDAEGGRQEGGEGAPEDGSDGAVTDPTDAGGPSPPGGSTADRDPLEEDAESTDAIGSGAAGTVDLDGIAGTDDPEEGAADSASRGATGEDGDVRVVPSVDPERTARAASARGDESEERPVGDGETVAGLRSELSARESRIEELRERLETVAAERDELASEREELARRVSRLEERLAESGAAPLDSEGMAPAEVLSGTDILVRYRSKAAPTLAEAHDGEADREDLADNLLLEPHTTFDAEGVSVAGRTFEAFLEGTQGVGFLRWLAGELTFELRDTGNVGSMRALYDALPSLDRVEFDAAVALEGGDRETVRFDLVGRDRRGEPLFVALLEDDRVPTTDTTMGEFLRNATAAAESHESLVAAFAVTSSYFEPEALETAEEATGGSLLSRNKRRSFVQTSRKGGYHLCLVEDREKSFYLSVPEL